MEQEHVDHVGLHAPKRGLDAESDDVARPVSDPRNAVAALRREEDLVATSAERAPEPLLRGAVARRGVEERDAAIERGADQRIAVALAETPVAERPSPEAEHRDLEPRPSERAPRDRHHGQRR